MTWNNALEELPPDGKYVLALMNGSIFIACHLSYTADYDDDNKLEGCSKWDRWQIEGCHGIFQAEFWCELPEPPNGRDFERFLPNFVTKEQFEAHKYHWID